MLSRKSVTENGKATFSFLCPITILEIHRGHEKERFSFAVEMGLPLAPLNFRLCLCGIGELLWVCGRPAGLLSHQ